MSTPSLKGCPVTGPANQGDAEGKAGAEGEAGAEEEAGKRPGSGATGTGARRVKLSMDADAEVEARSDQRGGGEVPATEGTAGAGRAGRGRPPSRIRVVTALAVTLVTLFTAAGFGAAASGGTWSDASRQATARAVAAAPLPLKVRQTVAAAFTFPGAAPQLDWPAHGQAALAVAGLGSMGSSGPADTPVPIASIAKTMTSYLILQDYPLAPGQNGPTITVSATQAAVYQKEAATTSDSLVPVTAGEQLTERDALYALMLASADNVAQILAQWDAGSTSAFLAKMNAEAARLGMAHTTFTDPSGLTPSTTSTAQDLVLLGEAVIQRPDFLQIVGTRHAKIPVAGDIVNYDGLLGTDGVIGIKTGSTSEAGSCLLFAASILVGGQPETIVGAVLGQYLGSGKGLLTSAMDAARALVVGGEQALGTAQVAASGSALAALDRGRKEVGVLTVAAPVTVVGWPGLGYQVSVLGTPTKSWVSVWVAGPGADPVGVTATAAATAPSEVPTTTPKADATTDAGPGPGTRSGTGARLGPRSGPSTGPSKGLGAGPENETTNTPTPGPAAGPTGPLADAGSPPVATEPLRPGPVPKKGGTG